MPHNRGSLQYASRAGMDELARHLGASLLVTPLARRDAFNRPNDRAYVYFLAPVGKRFARADTHIVVISERNNRDTYIRAASVMRKDRLKKCNCDLCRGDLVALP